jgi:hypothetical protein
MIKHRHNYFSLADFSPVSPFLDAGRFGLDVPTRVTDPDTAFHFNVDPDSKPAYHQGDANLPTATTGLQTLQDAILSLHASLCEFPRPSMALF